KRAYCLKTQPATGETYPKSDLFNKAEQTRYYRVKYYFDVSQVLTPEQRKQIRTDMANALAE
ncbi:hypothetical protein QCN14_25630, partial [Enterobacter roggenkampii]